MNAASILSAVRICRSGPPWAPHSTASGNQERGYKLSPLSILICLLTFFSVASAQQGLPQYSSLAGHCEGTIYKGNEIPTDHRAKIRNRTLPNMTQQALTDGINGTVVIEAVLCRNGQVTDLEVLQDLPNGLTDEAIRSVLGIEFTPAEINLHSVSQRMRFEFSFNERRSGIISSKDAEGKSIGGVEVIGNRTRQAEDIIAQLKTRPGDTYTEERMKQDLASLLSTGWFDPRGTSVSTEANARGDVVVIFEVQELPSIAEIRFEGLGTISEVSLRAALQAQNIDLRPGSLYGEAKVKTAVETIRKMLEQSGATGANVETRLEQFSFDKVSLTFVITH